MTPGDPVLPDARLTELLRAPSATAYPALQELRARHQPAVLAYALHCTTGDAAARRLTAQTLTGAARDIAHGAEPVVPLRHHLLLLTAGLAARWARDDRSAALDPAFLLVLNSSGGTEPPAPPLLTAFRSLPSRTQGLLWYGVLDGEPEARTAALLGLTPEDVRYGVPPALHSLAQACLRDRLAASDDPRCADFRRLIEEAVRPENPRHSADLHAHMTHCAHCTAAFEDLGALRDTPREALAEGLLPWAGTAYVRQRGAPAPAAEPLPGPRTSRRPPARRRLLLTSAALGVALVPLLLLLLDRPAAPARSTGTPSPPATPQVTVTATATVSPTPARRPSRGPSPSRSPSPTRPPSPSASPSASPAPRPPGASYAQVVNAVTGRCLDVLDADFDNGTDVVTAACSGAASQRWRVDADRGVLQSAEDPGFCLDSRGSVDKGVGIWQCSSVDGDHGDNLRFTVDPDGEIRPAIAIGTALTPAGDDALALTPDDEAPAQHWRAGAR
ncbi:RICIN domain-containing protein [Streptomyces humi]|uniref:RICIN domain-containing protein n=1 Tax=Streptomyces humi TaxID=1428620 RepID=UPI0006287F5D|nr:RICIN domain-containing protein [Streptomyces humi]